MVILYKDLSALHAHLGQFDTTSDRLAKKHLSASVCAWLPSNKGFLARSFGASMKAVVIAGTQMTSFRCLAAANW